MGHRPRHRQIINLSASVIVDPCNRQSVNLDSADQLNTSMYTELQQDGHPSWKAVSVSA